MPTLVSILTDQTETKISAKSSIFTVASPMKQKVIYDTRKRALHDLRISVIDRCNFRCTYCMPAEEYSESYTFLGKKEYLNFDEIVRLANLFVKLGVSKIRITGGEPLLRAGLSELIERLSNIHGVTDLALTTNGILLARQAKALKAAGLQRITVSLDTLDEMTFRRINGNLGSVAQVLEGIRQAEKIGITPIKINAVIQKGINDRTVLDLVRYFKGSGHILRFIEYMDVGNRNHWKPELVVPSREIVKRIQEEFPLNAIEANYHGEVASRYQFEDGKGEIGFISSITQPFCGTCTRARLSTDGKLYLCLFADAGVDLREPLRRGACDADISAIIETAWERRADRYSEERFTSLAHGGKLKKIEMYQIGG